MRRRERGKPEETRGPPGTEDRVVLLVKLIMIIQRWNREMIVTTKDCILQINGNVLIVVVVDFHLV